MAEIWKYEVRFVPVESWGDTSVVQKGIADSLSDYGISKYVVDSTIPVYSEAGRGIYLILRMADEST